MASFKIFLLNLQNLENDFTPKYSPILISEFHTSQQQNDDCHSYSLKHDDFSYIFDNYYSYSLKQDGFSYTFNEKFEKHPNSQKQLSFSTPKNIIRADRIETNPFINYLFVGTQLLLVDKYDQHHLMTIDKISYEFYESNTIFQYHCQDSFSYQLSRQNAGYEISNDLDSPNFIGARALDWWVLCKIHPECNISYSYLRLQDSRSFKPQYARASFPELYKTVPFSASGTANSVLIALGELYGLQLRTYERVNLNNEDKNNYGKLEKYYWFDLMKSNRPTGLHYSPNLDLQSFKLEHNGITLSSVLHVQSHSIGDKLITLLPSVPTFFKEWFQTQNWIQSEFSPGLFSSICKEKIYTVSWDNKKINPKDKFEPKEEDYLSQTEYFYVGSSIYIPINTEILSQYDFLSFTTSALDYSNFRFGSVSLYSKNNNWEIIGKTKKNTLFSIYSNINEIPHSLIHKEQGLAYLYLKLSVEDNTEEPELEGNLYIVQSRTPTTEEIEFAEIADQIPWLENKLINFQYFNSHVIINSAEHQDLMSILQNNLRKANAKLLLYSQTYYEAIQRKTELIANLSAKIDRIGAEFDASFISCYQNKERTRETTSFQLALSDLMQQTNNSTPLITYYDTLTEYVNKYNHAEQTFLKNIYLFRKYFNTYCNFGTIFNYTFSIKNTNEFKKFSFNPQLSYSKLTNTNSFNPIFLKQDSIYSFYNKDNIISTDNYKQDDLYVLNMTTPNAEPASGKWMEQTYFEKQWKTTCTKGAESISETPLTVKVNNYLYKIQVRKIDSNYWRVSCYQHVIFNPVHDNKITTIEGIEFTVQEELFERVSSAEIKMNYIYKTCLNSSATELRRRKIHRRVESDYRSSTNWLSHYSDSGMKPLLITYVPNLKNDNPENLLVEDDATFRLADILYQRFFPLTSFYWYGKKDSTDADEYHSVPLVTYETANQFYRKVSCSTSERKWNTGLSFLSPLSAVITAIIRHGWKNNNQSFSNDGWTYVDIFNTTLPSPFQRWYDGNRLVYVKQQDSYDATNGRNVFPSDTFDGNKWADEGKQIKTIDSSKWTYKEAINLLFTYNSFTSRLSANSKNKYKYKTKYWRILENTDYISHKESFYVLLQKEDSKDFFDIDKAQFVSQKLSSLSGERTINRLDSTIYYPLKYVLQSVTTEYFINENDNIDRTKPITVQNLLSNSMFLGNWVSNTVYQGSTVIDTDGVKEAVYGTIIFLKEEDYDYSEDFTIINNNNEIDYKKIAEFTYSKIYDNQNEQLVELKTLSDFTRDFYIIQEGKDYIATQDLIINNIEEYSFYKKINNDFEPRYTLQQLIQQDNFYVSNTDTYKFESFDSLTEIPVTYYIHNWNDNTWHLEEQQSGIIKKEGSNWLLKTENESLSLESIITETPCDSVTFGNFWYRYKDSKLNILREKALLIETNLSEYWTEAYYASKNCRFFLPEYWQPTINNKTNYFNPDILLTQNEIKNIKTNLISTDTAASNYSIAFSKPTECIIKVFDDNSLCTITNFKISCASEETAIDVSSNKQTNRKNNIEVTAVVTSNRNQITIVSSANISTVALDLYYTLDKSPNNLIKLSTTYIPQVSLRLSSFQYQLQHQYSETLKNDSAQMFDLEERDLYSLKQICSEYDNFNQITEYLNLNIDDWCVIKNNYATTYYTYEGGGCLWTNALSYLSDNLVSSDFFGGWYDMMIKTLQSANYSNYNPIEYRKAQEEHDLIWRQIYIKYPNLIYEQSFSNEDATTSRELLKMAQYAFKDYNEPENNYNISIIDTSYLKGYQGQNLNIGDSIEVVASEIYDDTNSDIYRSLSQYLYITDISYDLRRDDNVQLTVNSIKYQDKVIGQLIKLIR